MIQKPKSRVKKKDGKSCVDFECEFGGMQKMPEFVGEQVELRQWDPTDPGNVLPENFFLVLVGSRRIGKSVFAKFLMYFYRDRFDLALVCTQTPQNGFWQPIVGNQWVHQGINPTLLANLFASQTEEKAIAVSKKGYRARRVLIIFDDVIADRRKAHEDPWLNAVAVQGRHLEISAIVMTQYAAALNTYLRENADVAVIFGQKTMRSLEHVYNDFLSKLGPQDAVMEMMKTYTRDHDCIIVENWKLKTNAEEFTWWLPGDVTFDKQANRIRVPDYQLGCPEQKKLAKTKGGSLPLVFSEGNREEGNTI
ncbi:MAG: hypothetical protein EHM41_00980 [Chloroflexi bacterium]|nr:MAG: hypothetical protein EHM41_00980 [Chloroflexota bacterium]